MTHHRLPLSQDFSIWRDFAVRGAGFPAHLVDPLRDDDASAATDLYLDALRHVDEAWTTAERVVEEALAGSPEGANVSARVRARRLPRRKTGVEAVDAVMAAVEAAIGVAAARERDAAAALEQARRRTMAALAQAVRDPKLREAITWQNPRAIDTAFDKLIASPETNNSATRQHAQLAASYLQRYALKNDTIGFFGPVGWGSIVEEGSAFDLSASADLIGRRAVYFERWPFEALAHVWSQEEALRPYMRPRRSPHFVLEGAVLRAPVGEIALAPAQATVLAAVDGEKTARRIAAELAAELDEATVFATLRDLVESNHVTWAFEISTRSGPADRELRSQVEEIEPSLRERPMAMLDELEARRRDIAAVAGDPDALRAAIRSLEEAFERMTDLPAVRRGGQTYAARTLVREDCVREAKLRIGRAALDRLAPTLDLLLTSYRWLTARFAIEYRRLMLEIYEQARSTFQLDDVPVLLLWPSIDDITPSPTTGLHRDLQRCVREFQATWADLLGIGKSSGARAVRCTYADLEGRVREAFLAAGCGWPSARYHSPDVMLAAGSLEELQAGRFVFVLGEVHLGSNTLECSLFSDQREEKNDYSPFIAEDIGGRVGFVVHPGTASSRHAGVDTSHPDDVLIEYDETRSWRPRSQTLTVADLVASRRGDAVVVRTRDGTREWDALAFLEEHLEYVSVDTLPPALHVPRVTIDDVVLTRESWTFADHQLDFFRSKSKLERFAGARRWARENGFPSRVFAKASAEQKPFFVDFGSPLEVEALCHAARRSTKIRITEMLPDVAQCWLSDAAGRRYTSELRFVVLDERAAVSAPSRTR